MILSPISLKENISLTGTIKVDELIGLYRKATGIDVSGLKEKSSTIRLYKCLDSGYSFYYPPELAGDGLFYEELARQPWYYSVNRWEHRKAKELVPGQGTLLEMGCGSGFFLQMLKEAKPDLSCTGLEINEKAIAEGKTAGLRMINADIIDYAKENAGQFDFVCSFQVMEHIYNVREVLLAQIALLKKGGRLLVGVPNNDSYIGYNKHTSRCLNMPPHHMGLWDKNVFSYIEKEFGLQLKGIFEEPFSENDYTIYHYNHMLRMLKSQLLVKIYFKLRLPFLFKSSFMEKYKKKAVGHTILAIYQK